MESSYLLSGSGDGAQLHPLKAPVSKSLKHPRESLMDGMIVLCFHRCTHTHTRAHNT